VCAGGGVPPAPTYSQARPWKEIPAYIPGHKLESTIRYLCIKVDEELDIVEVAVAVEESLHLSAISYDAVKHLVLAKIERRTPRLNLAEYPFLPQASVGITDVRAYLALLQARVSHGELGVTP
jgi:hypothetical protein